MREVICIHIGNTGIRIGRSFWELFCHEQGIGADGQINRNIENLINSTSFFSENTHGKYIPRCVFADLESDAINEIRSSDHKELFESNQFINCEEGSANTSTRAYYNVGREIISDVTDNIRRLAYNCDSLYGILIFHNCEGGTGSGFASLLIDKLSVEYRKKSIFSFSVYPANDLSSPVAPFNVVLSTRTLMEHMDFVIIINNEALYDIYRQNFNLMYASYNNLNSIIAQIASSVTSSLRFTGSLNVNLNELQTNLVIYPRIHFPLCSYAPLTSVNENENNSATNITNTIFKPNSMMIKCDPSKGKKYGYLFTL